MIAGGPRASGFVALFLGVCVSICALSIGKDIGDGFLRVVSSFQKQGRGTNGGAGSAEIQETEDKAHARKDAIVLLVLIVCFGSLEAAVITGTVVDVGPGKENRRSYWASACFAPIGASIRWALSFSNQRFPYFPIGTFVANITGVILDTVIESSKLAKRDLSIETSFFLSALTVGLGGSLSTVSTWVSEAMMLPRLQRYIYILGTIFCAVTVGLVIYGTTFWVTA